MTVYLAVKNHTNWVDLRNLWKSEWDQALGQIDIACDSTDPISWRRTAHCGCVWTTKLSIKPRNSYHFIQILGRQRVQIRATIPIGADKSSAEQWCVKRGMTLRDMLQWGTRMHLTTEKSSGVTCTQRAEIRVPRAVSTYAPSIRKMTIPPREFTAKARNGEKMFKDQRKASRNTKLVEPRSMSKSTAKASVKMRWKQVDEWDEPIEVDQDQPKDKRSRSPPKSRDELCWMTRRWTKITRSLPTREGNQQRIWVWGVDGATNFKKREMTMSKCARPTSEKPPRRHSAVTHWEVDPEFEQSSPTVNPKAHRHVIYWDAPRCRPRSLPRSRPTKTTKSTMKVLRAPFESATMKSTGWSPKRTPKDNYLLNHHLEVNATYQWLPLERYSTKHCKKAQESAGALQLGKYNHP